MKFSCIQLSPQVIDVHIHHICDRLRRHLPHLGQQLAARDALATMQHQILQQRKLLHRQVDRPPRALYRVLDPVQMQIVSS